MGLAFTFIDGVQSPHVRGPAHDSLACQLTHLNSRFALVPAILVTASNVLRLGPVSLHFRIYTYIYIYIY